MQDSHLHAEYFPLLFLTIASKILNYPRGFPTKILAGPSIAGTVEDCELNFARRALQKIKARLGVDTTERLLQLDIDEAKTFWDDALKKNTTGELPHNISLVEGRRMLGLDVDLGGGRTESESIQEEIKSEKITSFSQVD
jgi:hypothetical protein